MTTQSQIDLAKYRFSDANEKLDSAKTLLRESGFLR